MLTAINEIFEVVATLLCVNYLFGEKYYFKIHDVIFLIFELAVIETANYLGLSKGMALFGYIGIYIYELMKFRCSIRKANANLVLVVILCVFAQVICSMPVFVLENLFPMDVVILLINVLMILLFGFIGLKGYIYRVSRGIRNYEMLNNILTGVCFAGAVYLLVAYKLEEYLRITDYIIFGIWTILIGVLVMSWQREKYDKMAKEKELELRKTYDLVFEQLLESIRKKQHDFHNQITAIYSQHMIAKDFDTLVSMQREYCGELLEDNKYARLLSGGSPVVIGFLYSKFIEAEGRGCCVEYEIHVDKLQCRIPQFKLIDLLGVLLDNAIEAVEKIESKNIFVGIQEEAERIHVIVKNDAKYLAESEIASFIQPGYTTKGGKRGIGLSKVVEILQEYGSELGIYYEKEEGSRIVFEFELQKEA